MLIYFMQPAFMLSESHARDSCALPMNVPTELFRAFVTVVDQRSYTRAARLLSLSQPAVSSQIKRLQELLGTELFDKSAPGVSLTAQGQRLLEQVRVLLKMHDEIVATTRPASAGRVLRIGVPDDATSVALAPLLSTFREAHQDVSFDIRSDVCDTLLQHVEQGQLDMCVAVTADEPTVGAVARWPEEVAWVAGDDIAPATGRDLDLIARGDGCVYRNVMLGALDRAGQRYRMTYVAPTIDGVVAAVRAGLGVSVIPKRLVPASLTAASAALPPLVEVSRGIYVGRPGDEVVSQLAQSLSTTLVR